MGVAMRRDVHPAGTIMKPNSVAAITCALSALLPCSCATSPPPGLSGRWTPVNHYAAAPDEIPLAQAYVFAPTPLDRTLKTMLSRWAADSGRTVLFQHPSDFALYGPVADIRTSRLQDALAMLNALYREQRVVVETSANAIVVRQRAVPEAGAPRSGSSVH